MSRHPRPMAVGGITVLVAAGSLVFAFTAQRHVPGRAYTNVAVTFDQVGPALRIGNDVRLKGVRIGQVKSIGFAHGKPSIVLQLEGHRKVFQDASASIASRSALGQKFVSFQPGHPNAGDLKPGTPVVMGPASNSADLDNLLDVFDPTTRRALGSAVRDVGSGTAGHEQDLNDALASAPTVLSDAAGVSDALSSDQAHLAEVLADAQRLSSRLTDRKSQIADAIAQSGQTLAAIGTDAGVPLADTTRKLPATLVGTRAALVALQVPLTDLHASLLDLSTGVRAIGSHTPQIRATLRDYVVPLTSLAALEPQLDRSAVTLTGLMLDARPFAPKVARAATLASTPLTVLAPYSPEIALWFRYAKSALAGHDANGHWLRFDILFNSESISGSGPLGTAVKDPITSRSAYPAPGVAQRQTAGATR
jgi:phospholipid/cholesterol/gamma-HCH transport system substrate-binding protein